MFEDYTTTKAILKDRFGMHGRPSTLIAIKCRGYDGKVYLTQEGDSEKYNCKESVRLMTMGAEKGTSIKIHVEGTDEKARELCKNIEFVINSDIDTIDDELQKV
jgi:phosphotransferase system HPr (HPr) family protein